MPLSHLNPLKWLNDWRSAKKAKLEIAKLEAEARARDLRPILTTSVTLDEIKEYDPKVREIVVSRGNRVFKCDPTDPISRHAFRWVLAELQRRHRRRVRLRLFVLSAAIVLVVAIVLLTLLALHRLPHLW